ncbi:MAG: group II truncated hemoglobin [Pseudomonadales bacterium]|nr:group II truncated hemoglobin [Pseudomonadales bacterium]NRA14385.1 group II truncated hemoglobin [Oceanospirillaceae bacterium]
MKYGVLDSSFSAAGGESGIYSLVENFYHQMETLPQAELIRSMHPADLTESIDKLARFLCGWLGGPKLYREKYGSISIPRAHQHLKVTATERDAWLLCMQQALLNTDYAEDFQQYLLNQLAVPANRCVNAD